MQQRVKEMEPEQQSSGHLWGSARETHPGTFCGLFPALSSRWWLPGPVFLINQVENDVTWVSISRKKGRGKVEFPPLLSKCPLAGGTQTHLSAASWGFLQKAAAGKVGRSLRDSVCVTQVVPTQPLPLCPSLLGHWYR